MSEYDYEGDEVAEIALPKPADVRVNRMTVVTTVTHQIHGEQPTGKQLANYWPTNIEDDAYSRRVLVEENWKEFDTGPFEPGSVGYVLIENNHGSESTLRPDKETQAEIEKGVLELAVDGVAFAEVRPGGHHDFEPVNLEKIRMRSRHGKIRLRVTVYPR